MDNNKKIIIGLIILIIAVAIVLVMFTSVNYERIDITPNGTSIEVPADNKTTYDGEFESVKLWHWDKGILVTYNSYNDSNLVKVGELGFNTLKEILENAEKQNVDGFTCYVINADELFEIHLFDVIKVNYNGKFYCIPLVNQSTHDNILICCNDRDMAVHMAQSVQYKNVYPEDAALNSAINATKNITGDLLSNYTNDTNLSQVESAVEEKTVINLDDVKSGIEQYTGKLPI